jgi:hypothetical protein
VRWNGLARTAWAGTFVSLLALLTLSQPAAADPSGASARTAQFVLVVDDSTSMSQREGRLPAADPDRLAVFAADALLGMLDDRDEATVLRLGAPRDEAPLPLAPLSKNRAALTERLSAAGALAAYATNRTPCRTALERLRGVLEGAYRPGVAQVVFYLTDGACWPSGEDIDAALVDNLLSGVPAASDGLFQFYFLRFAGRPASPMLERLAERSGGATLPVEGGDPTTILKAFADAFSRSQGYEAYLLAPRQPVIPSQLGARRVRLLAVAPGAGEALGVSARNARTGDGLKTARAARAGVHRFESGRTYRWAALDFVPDADEARVAVTGAGKQWRIIALPDYRLSVVVDFHAGACPPSGDPVRFVDVGTDACLAVKLVNEVGEPVAARVAGAGSVGEVLYARADEADAATLPGTRIGDRAIFAIDRPRMPAGDFIVRPRVQIKRSGADRAIRLPGRPRTLTASDTTITPTPARLDFGQLVPGARAARELVLQGNFKPTRGRLVVDTSQPLPACVSLAVSGVEAGKGFMISPGQAYSVEAVVQPYCGRTARRYDVPARLRLEFDRLDGDLPPVVIPTALAIQDTIALPEPIEVALTAGESQSIEVPLGGNQAAAVPFEAVLRSADEIDGWDGDVLRVGFEADGGGITSNESGGGPAIRQAWTHDPQAVVPLRLRVETDACCAPGTYRTELGLVPRAGSREPIRVPIVVKVGEAAWWACWGARVLWLLGAALGVLLLWFFWRMRANSRFLDKKALERALRPLVFTEWGDAEMAQGRANPARTRIKKSLSFGRRVQNWLAANPLKVGLPGGSYRETLAITLQLRDVTLSLRGEAWLRGDRERARSFRGRLFVEARGRGGVTFYVVPDAEGRVGMFVPDPEVFLADEERPEFVVLSQATSFVLMDASGDEGDPAGWRVG